MRGAAAHLGAGAGVSFSQLCWEKVPEGRMRAAQRSGAVAARTDLANAPSRRNLSWREHLLAATPSRSRAPALIRPSATFSRPGREKESPAARP
jgi:hypothetical protein